MARREGTLKLSSNIEPRVAAPLDARTIVPTLADLTASGTFSYPYVGMIVSVQSEGKAYMLTAADTTVSDNWQEVGSGSQTLAELDDVDINLIEWYTKTWTGLTNFSGDNIWSDGENIYYSSGYNQYVLDKSTLTWSTETWWGLTNFDGAYIWSDGENIYCSDWSNQYVLDKSTSTWTTKEWTGLTSINGENIWSDGENIYYSSNSNHYILDKSTSTWSTKEWTGLTSFSGDNIWSDGDNIYYSLGSSQYILDKSTSTWSTKTWTGLTNFEGDSIWTDGNNIYYSSAVKQYVLDKSTSTWATKEWIGVTNLLGAYIWTDGDNIYYSLFNTQCALKKHTEESLIYDWNNQKWVNKEIDIDIPKTFIGTTDEWEQLPLADKKTYKEAHFTDDVASIDISTLQTKDLATPITIGGTQQTTVEGALGGLNSAKVDIQLKSNTDLNDIRTLGLYRVYSTSGTTHHYPVNNAGMILVTSDRTDGIVVQQTFFKDCDPDIWTRAYNNGTWSEWKKLVTDDITHSVLIYPGGSGVIKKGYFYNESVILSYSTNYYRFWPYSFYANDLNLNDNIYAIIEGLPERILFTVTAISGDEITISVPQDMSTQRFMGTKWKL